MLGGELQIEAKNSDFEIFESILFMKSGSIPLKVVICVNSTGFLKMSTRFTFTYGTISFS